MNNKIEELLKNFIVDGKKIPSAPIYYDGKETTYITYQEINIKNTFYADDERQYFNSHYDFDVYSKDDYTNICVELINTLETGGFRWVPEYTSEDMYDNDTEYYHKTLCFSKERNDI